MAVVIPDILARIVDRKRAALGQLSSNRDELERQAATRSTPRNFKAAISAQPPSIIAEIKKASPSQGVFTGDFRPDSIARMYAEGGAAALSVLTDEEFFGGCIVDLESARRNVRIPVLRKDFTIDELHVLEAAAHGADAILLIAAILDETQMRRFRELACQYGMAALVEIHDETELGPALDSGAAIIGVNNRNLHTFEVDLNTSLKLAEKIPASITKVAESGIHSREDVTKLQAAGYKAFLIGERLMKSADPAAAIRMMRS